MAMTLGEWVQKHKSLKGAWVLRRREDGAYLGQARTAVADPGDVGVENHPGPYGLETEEWIKADLVFEVTVLLRGDDCHLVYEVHRLLEGEKPESVSSQLKALIKAKAADLKEANDERKSVDRTLQRELKECKAEYESSVKDARRQHAEDARRSSEEAKFHEGVLKALEKELASTAGRSKAKPKAKAQSAKKVASKRKAR